MSHVNRSLTTENRILASLSGEQYKRIAPHLNGSSTTDEALKAGADEAMHKPVDFTSLIGCVNQLLVK